MSSKRCPKCKKGRSCNCTCDSCGRSEKKQSTYSGKEYYVSYKRYDHSTILCYTCFPCTLCGKPEETNCRGLFFRCERIGNAPSTYKMYCKNQDCVSHMKTTDEYKKLSEQFKKVGEIAYLKKKNDKQQKEKDDIIIKSVLNILNLHTLPDESKLELIHNVINKGFRLINTSLE